MTSSFIGWYELPPRCLHPNHQRGNSRASAIMRSQAKHKYRNHVRDITNAILYGPRDYGLWAEATAQLTFIFPRRARRDTDNLDAWFKSGFDGLVGAGLLQDDEHLTRLPTRIEIDRDEPFGRVRCEVWPTTAVRVEAL